LEVGKLDGPISIPDAASLSSSEGNLEAVGPTKARRANQVWATQANPVASDLRALSQPTDVASVDDVPDFVYQEEAGKGVVIYHVEYGINADNDVSVIL
jgi:hypothetical protein